MTKTNKGDCNFQYSHIFAYVCMEAPCPTFIVAQKAMKTLIMFMCGMTRSLVTHSVSFSGLGTGGSYKKIGYYDSTKGNLSWYGTDKWIGESHSSTSTPLHSHPPPSTPPFITVCLNPLATLIFPSSSLSGSHSLCQLEFYLLCVCMSSQSYLA